MQGDNPLRDGLLYFNPRSHKGSDEDGSSLTAVTIGISIHAPTRGATGCPGMLPVCWCISIHAPTRGATGLCGWNPRIDTISIHAPTRGATLYNLIHVPTMAFQSTLPQGERLSPSLNLANFQDFNPRSHKGSDIVQSVLKTTKAEFQSTLPQGERLISPAIYISFVDFNPRSHKGSDGSRGQSDYSERRFQSTLPQGERLVVVGTHFLVSNISIHAPTRGATQLPPGSHPGIKHFNPRSHKGSDQGEPSGQRKKVISIHAPTRGATKKDVQEGLK